MNECSPDEIGYLLDRVISILDRVPPNDDWKLWLALAINSALVIGGWVLAHRSMVQSQRNAAEGERLRKLVGAFEDAAAKYQGWLSWVLTQTTEPVSSGRDEQRSAEICRGMSDPAVWGWSARLRALLIRFDDRDLVFDTLVCHHAVIDECQSLAKSCEAGKTYTPTDHIRELLFDLRDVMADIAIHYSTESFSGARAGRGKLLHTPGRTIQLHRFAHNDKLRIVRCRRDIESLGELIYVERVEAPTPAARTKRS